VMLGTRHFTRRLIESRTCQNRAMVANRDLESVQVIKSPTDFLKEWLWVRNRSLVRNLAPYI
jgi:hypothetical protein